MWRSLSLLLFLLCVLNTNAQNTRIIQIFYTQIQKVNSLYKSFFVSVFWIECECCKCVCVCVSVCECYAVSSAWNFWLLFSSKRRKCLKYLIYVHADARYGAFIAVSLPSVRLSVKYLQFEYIFSILHACCVCVSACVYW